MLSEEELKVIENCDCPRCKLPIEQDRPTCVSELLATTRELQARVAELERQCERCGLKLAHDPTPGITVCQSELTFTPGEVIYIPATVRYYPSATPGEPDVKEETYP
jgi:uncharacterized paraquat-inducible protein A